MAIDMAEKAGRRSQYLTCGFGLIRLSLSMGDITAHAGDTMRVDASQVCSGEYIGGLVCVRLGDAKMHENASAEFAQRFAGKILVSTLSTD